MGLDGRPNKKKELASDDFEGRSVSRSSRDRCKKE